METACLRIRFTPLLQNIQKEESKHYLEIIPEISCIQNLDKIQWRKEENSIEYTIPMTYKIILRKKEINNDKIEQVGNLDKIYHSCVDLMLPSSDTTLMPQGSGDINRIVSDTFVLSKVTTDVEKCSIMLRKDNENEIDNSIEFVTTQVQTGVNSSISITSQLLNNELDQASKRKAREMLRKPPITQTPAEVVQNESLTQVSHTDIFDCIKRSIDKLTNADSSTASPVKGIKSLGAETRLLKFNGKTETARKLSVTPICSINTDEEISKGVAEGISNKIVFRVFESQNYYAREIDGTMKNNTSLDLFYDINNGNPDRIFTTMHPYDYISSHRILPEIRVANFVQIMEKEIRPLKRMLGDILNKCSTLGFTWTKSQQTPVMYKNVPSSDKQISRCLKTKKQIKSNRVVYTIVFDG